MPEDEITEQQPVEAAEEPQAPETPPAEEQESAEPHPLEPGGQRFRQVYARAKSAEEKADRLEREIQDLRDSQNRTNQQSTTQTLEQQVEAAVEAGTMSQVQAIQMLSKHYAKAEAKATVAHETTEMAQKRRLQEASDGIQAFVSAAPDIETLTHPRIGEVRSHYDALIRRGYEPGLPTELLSLEMTFGSPDKLKRSRNPSDRSTSPVNSGGTSVPKTPAKNEKDGLAGIPQRYLDYWSKRGYSHEDMVAEAAYLTPEQKARKE